MAAAEQDDGTPNPRHRKTSGQIGGEQRAEQCRRKVIGRRRQVKAHVSEGGDEVEQDAEANRVDRKEPWIAEMRDDLFGGGGEAARAYETALARQRNGHDDRANKRYERHRAERCAPAEQIGYRAGGETAAEPADARTGNKQPGDARNVGWGPFIAHI